MTVPLINCQSDADADGKTGQANLKTLNRQMPFHEMPVFCGEEEIEGEILGRKVHHWMNLCLPSSGNRLESILAHSGITNWDIFVHAKKGNLSAKFICCGLLNIWCIAIPQMSLLCFAPIQNAQCFVFHKYNCATCIQLTCYYHPAMCEIGMLI